MKNAEEIASQKKMHSLIESLVNVVVGFVINVTAQHFIFPLFGIRIPLATNLEIGMVFTIISIIRSFGLRRIFNAWHVRLANS